MGLKRSPRLILFQHNEKLSAEALLTCIWHCQKRWSCYRFLVVGTFLNFNSVELGPLPSWCNRLPCPDKELDKNRQALPSFRRRICKDFALRHQIPYYLSWTSVPWLVSGSHLHSTGRRPMATSEMLWDEVFIRLFDYHITECSCRRLCTKVVLLNWFGQGCLYSRRRDCLLAQALEVVLTSTPHPFASLFFLGWLNELFVTSQLNKWGKSLEIGPFISGPSFPLYPSVHWVICMLGREFFSCFLLLCIS